MPPPQNLTLLAAAAVANASLGFWLPRTANQHSTRLPSSKSHPQQTQARRPTTNGATLMPKMTGNLANVKPGLVESVTVALYPTTT
ncbi:hypothetical protein FA95DRAFT_1603362 [Auriscalpium vulgare]|uniref:Uncharacterized protein n=1 Tax=Auriscalpium vulgare TaxID=40419 RepID=A0ACB8S4A1_9AGAM|nr:hypothetical protein FA95DRAFT_1603362 [Auriscalpium vulgare]